jgi:hypothetical protein
MTRNGTTATPAIVTYWRRRYAAAPSCTARAISCIRSLPAGCRNSHMVKYKPQPTATAAQTSANATALSLKKSIEPPSRKPRHKVDAEVSSARGIM